MSRVPPGTPGGSGETPEPWPWGSLDDMERAVIGCCLLPLGGYDQHALTRQVMQTLPEDVWRDPRHWRILRMVATLSRLSRLVEPETVAHHLRGKVPGEYIEALAYRLTDSAQLLPGRLKRLRAAYGARRGYRESIRP